MTDMAVVNSFDDNVTILINISSPVGDDDDDDEDDDDDAIRLGGDDDDSGCCG